MRIIPLFKIKKPHGNYARIAIPLIKKAYPRLIVNDLIKVQPMTGKTAIDYLLTRGVDPQGDGHERISVQKAPQTEDEGSGTFG